MRCLKNLPVWVVIRLCTNDNNMTQYWNGIDSEVELNMDVIDDPLGEAKEIHKYVLVLTPIFLFFIFYSFHNIVDRKKLLYSISCYLFIYSFICLLTYLFIIPSIYYFIHLFD